MSAKKRIIVKKKNENGKVGVEKNMVSKKCLNCKFWVKFYNSNKHYCKRGYCIKSQSLRRK